MKEQASAVQNLICLKSKMYCIESIVQIAKQIGLDWAESAKLPSEWILWPYIQDLKCNTF